MLTWCLTALIACNLHNTAEYVLGVSIIIWVFKEDTSHEHPSAWLFSAPLLFWWRRHQGTSLPMPSTIQSNPVQWVQTHRICTLLCYVRYRIDPTAKINHINEAIARLIKQPFSHVTSWLIVWLKAGSWCLVGPHPVQDKPTGTWLVFHLLLLHYESSPHLLQFWGSCRTR